MSITDLYKIFLKSSGISTDTRSLKKDHLFFALKGEHFDGNQYAEEAIKKGALAAVIDNPDLGDQPYYIKVEDALQCLQKLAAYHRQQLHIPVIAIGGSNGKTTTKQLSAAVLAEKYHVFATPGNFNNHIGVPLSLLQITPETEIALIEMGANHLGEIELLCQIAMPTHGLITNIGKDHLEGFGSIEGVAKANSELFYYLYKNGGTVFVDTNEAPILRMASRFTKPITYPNDQDDFPLKLSRIEDGKLIVKHQDKEIPTQLTGIYNFSNLASAWCIGKFFNVEEESIGHAFESFIPQNNRSQVIKKGSNTLLLDAYNANPSSMQAALTSFVRSFKGQKSIILGEMLELGDHTQKEHEELGKLIAQIDFEYIILYGKAMQYALPFNSKALYFTDKFSLNNWLQHHPIQKNHILIKGSRGAALESILDFF